MKVRILATNEVVKVYRTNECALSCKGTVYKYKSYDGKQEYWSNEIESVPDDVPLSDSDLRISVAKLREVLESHFAHRILHSEIDEIINRVKKEI